jgi:hypothetical protein
MEMMNYRPTRFFFHFNRPASLKAGTPKLSIHWNNSCRIVDKIICNVPTESRINKRQPRVVMIGKSNYIEVSTEIDGTEIATIESLPV